ncbi:hypothetical protein [Thermococcus henrietii]|uniref:hypothetical protein n=1 Tax=Thermococcus henrietii TaxID=2016361 RepID=UPI000C08A0F1|nr:hypothetical protein [Thermococcus henrietii]
MPRDGLDSLLKKWEMQDLIRLARESDDALVKILNAVSSEDIDLRLGALSALLELVKTANWRERKRILELGFDTLVDALSTDDPRVLWRTLAILSALLKNNPLNGVRLLKLVKAITNLAETRNVVVWDELLNVVDNIMAPYIGDDVACELKELLKNGTAGEALIVAMVLLETGAMDKDCWVVLVERISSALLSGEPRLIDAGLVASLKISKLPPVYSMDVLIKELLPALRRTIVDCKDQLRKMHAVEVFDKLRETLVRYYRVRPREAQRVVEELMRLGLVDEAYIISSAIGTIPSSPWEAYGNRGRL